MSPATIATTPPPKNFSGRRFPANPNMLPTFRSTRSRISLSPTCHHHPAATTMSPPPLLPSQSTAATLHATTIYTTFIFFFEFGFMVNNHKGVFVRRRQQQRGDPIFFELPYSSHKGVFVLRWSAAVRGCSFCCYCTMRVRLDQDSSNNKVVCLAAPYRIRGVCLGGSHHQEGGVDLETADQGGGLPPKPGAFGLFGVTADLGLFGLEVALGAVWINSRFRAVWIRSSVRCCLD
nr:hypothetical protein [Tanacetum cinerariifolium]